MQPSRFLECLATDASTLRNAAARDLTAPVPSCPGWSVDELVRHTALVYLHKAECMRLNAFPDPWPPDLSKEEPLALFDRAYNGLTSEFDKHAPTDRSVTWYEPDQTVGFWIRRMAQETVIHRVDAQLAARAALTPIPDDLAADGIDEVLVCFLGYGTTGWPGEYENLKDYDGRAVGLRAGSRSWAVSLEPDGVVLSSPDDADATVSGDPGSILLWLWGRSGDESIKQDGDVALIAQLRKLLVESTQ